MEQVWSGILLLREMYIGSGKESVQCVGQLTLGFAYYQLYRQDLDPTDRSVDRAYTLNLGDPVYDLFREIYDAVLPGNLPVTRESLAAFRLDLSLIPHAPDKLKAKRVSPPKWERDWILKNNVQVACG